MSEKIRIIEHPLFDVISFRDRWKAARLAALRSVIQDDIPALDFDEGALLGLISDDDHDKLLRLIFDNSRKFGMSAVRYFGFSWELSDLQDILSQTHIPCLNGTWSNGVHAKILSRSGCDEQKQIGSFYCDYWREALDGLSMGVGETERYARHESVGHGDNGCVDVFFDDAVKIDGLATKWGEIPSVVVDGLAPLQGRFKELKIKLSLKGLSEGILYYLMEKDMGVLCGNSAKMYNEMLAKEVGARFPGLGLQDASPLAVYGEGTK